MIDTAFLSIVYRLHVSYKYEYRKFDEWEGREMDEVFFVIEGEMQIDFRDRSVVLKAGEMFVVSKGVEHKPYAKEECKVMLIEPAGTVNTGDVVDAQTASHTDWI